MILAHLNLPRPAYASSPASMSSPSLSAGGLSNPERQPRWTNSRAPPPVAFVRPQIGPSPSQGAPPSPPSPPRPIHASSPAAGRADTSAFDFDILLPSGAKALLDRSERHISQVPPPATVARGGPSFFHTLEELVADHSASSNGALEARRMVPSSPVGSGDPRPNIVSQRVLSTRDADLLLDL
jgi:hypothetical protein